MATPNYSYEKRQKELAKKKKKEEKLKHKAERKSGDFAGDETGPENADAEPTNPNPDTSSPSQP